MESDGWRALLMAGLCTLIAAPLAFQAQPSEARIALFAALPPVLLAGLVLLRKKSIANRS